MTDPRRILIIRPSALGDVCRSVPVLVSLRARYPEADIDWLVRDAYADAIRAHPALTGVIPFARTDLGRSLRAGRPAPTLRFLLALRNASYDLVIDAQGLARSAIFAWATRAPRRIGFANAREGAPFAYTERHHVERAAHTVDRMLALLDRAGIPPVHDVRLAAPEADRHWVESQATRSDHVVIAPTSIWPSKRWPADRFAKLAENLLDAAARRIAIVGAPSERDQCAPLIDLAARDDRVTDLVGRTSVGQLMAVIERSRLVIANDSAALHMAVGFDRPIVALFGPTRTDLVGPYRRDDDVIQHVTPDDSLSHKHARAVHLMERISIDEVTEAALARLEAPAPDAARRDS